MNAAFFRVVTGSVTAFGFAVACWSATLSCMYGGVGILFEVARAAFWRQVGVTVFFAFWSGLFLSSLIPVIEGLQLRRFRFITAGCLSFAITALVVLWILSGYILQPFVRNLGGVLYVSADAANQYECLCGIAAIAAGGSLALLVGTFIRLKE